MKLLLAILLLFGVRAAFAVDGQVLINQVSVMAAGGFPYKITQPGSYKLSGNLVGPLNTAIIQILTNNVVLDLNGFNVRCSFSPPTGFGLTSCIHDNAAEYTAITIRNGSVTAVGNAPTFTFAQLVTGIYLRSGSTLIEQIHFTAEVVNYDANGLTAGPYSIFRNNTFSNGASPSFGCPSLVDGNTNQTTGAGAYGSGCKYVNNVGVFAY